MHVLSIRVQEQDNGPIQCQVTVVATLFAKLTNLDVVTVVLFKSTLQVSISNCWWLFSTCTFMCSNFLILHYSQIVHHNNALPHMAWCLTWKQWTMSFWRVWTFCFTLEQMLSLCTLHRERTMISNSTPLLGIKYSRKAFHYQVSHLLNLVYFALFSLLNLTAHLMFTNRLVACLDQLRRYWTER